MAAPAAIMAMLQALLRGGKMAGRTSGRFGHIDTFSPASMNRNRVMQEAAPMVRDRILGRATAAARRGPGPNMTAETVQPPQDQFQWLANQGNREALEHRVKSGKLDYLRDMRAMGSLGEPRPLPPDIPAPHGARAGTPGGIAQSQAHYDALGRASEMSQRAAGTNLMRLLERDAAASPLPPGAGSNMTPASRGSLAPVGPVGSGFRAQQGRLADYAARDNPTPADLIDFGERDLTGFHPRPGAGSNMTPPAPYPYGAPPKPPPAPPSYMPSTPYSSRRHPGRYPNPTRYGGRQATPADRAELEAFRRGDYRSDAPGAFFPEDRGGLYADALSHAPNRTPQQQAVQAMLRRKYGGGTSGGGGRSIDEFIRELDAMEPPPVKPNHVSREAWVSLSLGEQRALARFHARKGGGR